jgi:hypothetical protein
MFRSIGAKICIDMTVGGSKNRSIVAYRPITMQRPRKNKNKTTDIAMKLRGKHFSTTIELLLEPVFSTRSVQTGNLKDNWGHPVNCSCGEAGSNTSTVTLRVVGGDEKGSLESETVNYGHEFHGSRTRKCLHWQGPGAIVNNRPVLSSERAPHVNKPVTV